MPRNPQELVRFLADHYQIVQAMCSEHRRFVSDEEIAAFLRRFADVEGNPMRLITRMKQVGVLISGADEWSVPAFLLSFIQELQNQYALATPEIVRGAVAAMARHAAELDKLTAPTAVSLATLDHEALSFCLDQIQGTLNRVVRNVQGNCERIASEVIEFRQLEEAGKIRSRLRRLIRLHDEYLDPVIRIIDINGDFYEVTDQIDRYCSRLIGLAEDGEDPTAARSLALRRDVVWMRRAILRRAHEAKHELAPLCEAAVCESKIAKGVQRAVESIRQGRWDRLDLETKLPVAQESVRRLFSDQSVRNYVAALNELQDQPPPRVQPTDPPKLQLPWSADTLIADLARLDVVDDLIAWIGDRCKNASADQVFVLLERIIAKRDESKHGEDRLDYRFDGVSVNAARWTWEVGNAGRSAKAEK